MACIVVLCGDKGRMQVLVQASTLRRRNNQTYLVANEAAK